MGKISKHGSRRAEAAALRASFEPIRRRMDATETWNSQSNGYAVTSASSASARAVAALQPGLGIASRKAAEEAVKELQRADPAGNALWWAFCDRYGGGARDPCRHKLSFLQKFLVEFTRDRRAASMNTAPAPAGLENDFEASQTQNSQRNAWTMRPGASQTCPELPHIMEEDADYSVEPQLAIQDPFATFSPNAALPRSVPPGLLPRNQPAPLGARSVDEAESLLDAIHRAGLGDSLRNLQASGGSSPESVQEMRRAMLHEVTMKLQSMIGKEAMDSLETQGQLPIKDPREEWQYEEQAPWQAMLPQMPQMSYPESVQTMPEMSMLEQEGYHRSMSRTCPGSLPSLEENRSSSSSSFAPRSRQDFRAQPRGLDPSRLGSAFSQNVLLSKQEDDRPVLGQALMAHGQPGHAQTCPDLPLIYEEEEEEESMSMTSGKPPDLPPFPTELLAPNFKSLGRIGEARTCPELPLVLEEEVTYSLPFTGPPRGLVDSTSASNSDLNMLMRMSL